MKDFRKSLTLFALMVSCASIYNSSYAESCERDRDQVAIRTAVIERLGNRYRKTKELGKKKMAEMKEARQKKKEARRLARAKRAAEIKSKKNTPKMDELSGLTFSDGSVTPDGQAVAGEKGSLAPVAAGVFGAVVAAGGNALGSTAKWFKNLSFSMPTFGSVKNKITFIDKKTAVMLAFMTTPVWTRGISWLNFKRKFYATRLKEAGSLVENTVQEYAPIFEAFKEDDAEKLTKAINIWTVDYKKQEGFLMNLCRSFDYIGGHGMVRPYSFLFMEYKLKKSVALLEYYEHSLIGQDSDDNQVLAQLSELIKDLHTFVAHVKTMEQYQTDMVKREEDWHRERAREERAERDGKDYI